MPRGQNALLFLACRRGPALCAVAFLARNCPLPAVALPTFEPFAYAPGAALSHQTNALGETWAQWNGGTATSRVLCTNANLSYGGFPSNFPPPSPTNAVYLPGNLDHSGGLAGLSAALTFSRAIQADPLNLQTNSIYASFLLQVPNLGTLNSGGPTYFAGFATNTGDQNISLPASALKLFLKGNSATAGQSTTWSIGIANNSGSASAAFDAGGHTTNDVLFIVVNYTFGLNGNPDAARLWVNPDSANFRDLVPPIVTARTADITGNNRIACAADFFLLDRTGSTLWGGLLISDLRVATSWSYVTGGLDLSAATPPQLSVSAARGKLLLNATNGAPGATNFLLSSTNPALPLANWQPVATNLFDPTGHVILTNTINPNVPRQFYALRANPPPPNPLWIPDCGALLGAACSNGTAQAVADFETLIGRQNDILRIYHTPGSWTKLTATELTFINSGRKLLESIKPDSQWSNAVGVASGGSATVDSQLTSLAKSIAAVRPAKIMLIVWHEPENDVIGSVPNASAGTTAEYVANVA